METILVGTDGSRGAAEAVRDAIELAGRVGASVTFVGIRRPPLPVLGDPYYGRAITAGTRSSATAISPSRSAGMLRGACPPCYPRTRSHRRLRMRRCT